MSKLAYLLTIEDALLAIEVAKKEAIGVLSPEITKQHWIAAKHSPDPWLVVSHWYGGTDGYTEEVALTLDALVALSICQQSLVSVLSGAMPKQPPNLKLAKTRRSS